MTAQNDPVLRDEVKFLADMLIMSGTSSRLAFVSGIEELETSMGRADRADFEVVRTILRTVVSEQVERFADLLDRIDRSKDRHLALAA